MANDINAINKNLMTNGINTAENSNSELLRKMARTVKTTNTMADFVEANNEANNMSLEVVDDATNTLLGIIEESMDFLADERFPSFEDYLPTKTTKNKKRR